MKYASRLKLTPITFYTQQKITHNRNSGILKGDRPCHTVVNLVSDEQRESVLSVLPKELADKLFYLTLITVKSTLPHIHINDGDTVINWYLETNQEVLTFYDGEIRDVTSEWVEDVDNAYFIPDPTLLRPVASFTAKENEIWMLDATKPHSVSLYPNETDIEKKYLSVDGTHRLMLHACFNCDYEYARNIMKKNIVEEI